MKNLSKKALVTLSMLLVLPFVLSACDALGGGGEFPSRDISVVVPWGAGGGTDLAVRTLVYEMGNDLGVNMPVSNMPGASGSVGKIDVYGSPSNGYRILGSSMTSVTTAQVMGFSDISHRSWHAWNSAFAPSIVAVRAESPYQTIEELIAALQANPGGVTASSAGIGSSGHIGAIAFADAVGATFNHIPYEGGNPAIIAVLGGEVDFTAQLSSEMIDFIRSGDMRPLAALSPEDMHITDNEGNVIVVPSLAHTAPAVANILPIGASFGLFVPQDTPGDIVATLDAAYHAAVNSATFRNFVDSQGMVFVGMNMTETAAYLDRNASVVSWILYDVGAAPLSPADFGIARP